MKLNLKKIDFSKFKNIFKRKRKLLGYRNPTHDWIRTLQLFTLLSIAIIGLGVFVFFGIDKGKIFTIDTKSTTKTTNISRTTIQVITSFYQDREDRLNELKKNGTTVVDPSL